MLVCSFTKADTKDFNFTDYNFYGELRVPLNVSKVTNDSLVFGDTTAFFDLNGAKSFILTAQDSSNSKVDSLKCYLVTSPRSAIGVRYSLLAMFELSQTTRTTYITLLIPGDGVTTSYKYEGDTEIYGVYVVRLNAGTNVALAGYPYKTSIGVIFD